MAESLALILVACLIVAAGVAAQRSLTLFEIVVERGQVVRARGRLPQSLLHEFLDVCPRGLKERLVIRCRIERGSARLITQGPFDDDTVQRLRNLLGLWPLARLKAVPRLSRSKQ